MHSILQSVIIYRPESDRSACSVCKCGASFQLHYILHLNEVVLCKASTLQ